MAMIQKLNTIKHASYQLIAFCGYNSIGKQIRKTTTWRAPPEMSARKAEKEATRLAQIFEDKVSRGAVAYDGTTRFDEYSSQWLESSSIAPKTRQRYEGLLVRINAEIGRLKLDNIQAHHLEAFYQKLRQEEKKSCKAIATNLKKVVQSSKITHEDLAVSSHLSLRTISNAFGGRSISLESAKKIASTLSVSTERIFELHMGEMHLSDRTILHYHRLIAAILATAKRERIVAYNVASEHTRAPKVKRKEALYLDDIQARRLVELLLIEPDIRVKTSILLLLYSGVRRGELCGLEWEDVDFINCLIHVRRGSQYIKGMGIIDVPTKTDSSQRSIRLPSIVMEQLEQYRKWYLENKLCFGTAWNNSGKIFIQPDGKPIHPDTINYFVSNFRRKHNLEQFSPHSLRHTFSTLQIMAGINIRTIQARTGHSQASTLINTYSHAIKSADELATRALDDLLTPSGNKHPIIA